MTGYNVAIANCRDHKLVFEKALDIFKELQTSEINEKKVFIQVDLSFPEGFPTVFNSNLLKIVIDYCLSLGAKKIMIGGVPLFGISSRYIWNSLGFANFFEKDNIEFIALEEEKIEKKEFEVGKNKIKIHYPTAILDADFYISIVNPKFDLDFELKSTILNSLSLVSWKERQSIFQFKSTDENEDSGKFFEDFATTAAELYFIKPPNMSIIDMSSLSDSFGPFLYSDSKLLDFNYLIVSNNGVIADIVAMEMCNIEISKSKIIQAIEQRNPALIDNKNIENIHLFESNGLIIRKIDIKKKYLSKGSSKIDNSNSKLSNPEEILKSQENHNSDDYSKFPTINNVPELPTIGEIFSEKAEICSGKLCLGCKNSAMQLLFLLKSAFVKDNESIDDFSLVIGKNPPESEKKKKIIVFGDCAVNSTINQEFRAIKKQKKVRTEKEVEKERIRFQAKIREKILEWESKKASIEENIKIQIKDPQKQQRAIESLKKKDEKLRNEMDKKNKKYLEKEEKKRQKEIEKGKIIKYKVNKGVIEIPGCPPDGFEYLAEIIKLFKKKWVSTLSLWNNVMDLFYNREEYERFYQVFVKNRKEIIKIPE